MTTAMETAAKYKIGPVIESLLNGQWRQAKEELQRGCKTKPEKQARKLGQVIGHLCDTNRGDMAVRFLKMFDQ